MAKRFKVPGYGKAEAIIMTVDEQDAYLLRGMVWNRNGNARHVCKYDGMGSTIDLSNFILGVPSTAKVDHLDGDRTNCTRANMRVRISEKVAA